MCAYLNNHKLGLKQALQPLYDIVAKSPFVFNDSHRLCYDKSFQMLLELDPYWLPDKDLPLFLITDASGGTVGDGLMPSPGHWSAVLGQRTTADSASLTPMAFNEGFKLLQIAGGSFNERQAAWPVIEKEYFAIFSGFVKFDQYIRGRRIILLTDSKVLLHAFRSANHKIRRWYSYVQGFDFDVQHITSEQNALCDALTRCVSLAQPLPTPHQDTLPPTQTFTPAKQRAVRQAPLISLLDDGDVESNPGPRTKDTTIINVSSDASSMSDPITWSSDDDRPLVTAPVVDGAAAPAHPAHSPQPGRRRSRADAALSPISPPVVIPSSVLASPDLAAAPASRPPAIFRLHLATPTLLDRHPTSLPSNSFFAALSAALLFETFAIPLSPSETHAAHKLNIREATTSHLLSNASTRFDIFDGIPLRDVIRSRYVTSRDNVLLQVHASEDLVTVSSWRDYHQKMTRPTFHTDPTIACVAALLFRTQIILVRGDSHCVLNPDDGVRRVFLFVHDDNSYSWLHVSDAKAPPPPRNSHLFFQRAYELEVNGDSILFKSSPPVSVPQPRASDFPRAHHVSILHEFHCGYTGHPGVEATRQAIAAAGHSWRGMTRDIRAFIRSCPTCSVTLVRHAAARASAIPNLRETDKPLSRLHLDHVDFATCTHTGFKAACALVCEVTGFTFLAGSRFKSALEVALALITFSSIFQVPDSLHTDGGPEFANAILKEFRALTGLKHTFGIPNAPNTNGIAERNVALTSRFLRSICIDFGRNSAWGLYLPLVMKAVNHLPRRSLSGCSPHSFIFSSLNDDDPNVFPLVPSAIPSDEPLVFDSVNLPTSFASRAIYSQQVLINATCEHRDRLLQAANRKDERKPPKNFKIGDQVLLDWSGDTHPQRKDKLLPTYRGPYVITAVHNNTLHLVHSQVPPPPHQPSSLVWSRHARVYSCELDFERSPSDPSAANVPLSSPAFSIECILNHQLRQDLPESVTSSPAYFSQDVRHQVYEVRYYHSSAPGFVRVALRMYDDIAHTSAMDNYVLGNPALHSHTPCCAMPASWNPLLKGRSRPFRNSIPAERALRDETSSQSSLSQ
jgi:hypothetical protein